MYHPRIQAWFVAAFAAAVLTSCHRKAPAPVTPARVGLPKAEPPAVEPPKPLPPAPKIATVPPENPPVLVEVKPPPPPKKDPPPPKKKARASRRPRPAEPKPVEAAQAKPVEAPPESAPAAATNPAPAPAVPEPRLAPMLTPNQTKEYAKKLDGALDRAKNAVGVLEKKALSSEQKDTVTTIKSFVAQAEQAREQDLVSAVSLAERADLLSRDLLDRLR